MRRLFAAVTRAGALAAIREQDTAADRAERCRRWQECAAAGLIAPCGVPRSALIRNYLNNIQTGDNIQCASIPPSPPPASASASPWPPPATPPRSRTVAGSTPTPNPSPTPA